MLLSARVVAPVLLAHLLCYATLEAQPNSDAEMVAAIETMVKSKVPADHRLKGNMYSYSSAVRLAAHAEFPLYNLDADSVALGTASYLRSLIKPGELKSSELTEFERVSSTKLLDDCKVISNSFADPLRMFKKTQLPEGYKLDWTTREWLGTAHVCTSIDTIKVFNFFREHFWSMDEILKKLFATTGEPMEPLETVALLVAAVNDKLELWRIVDASEVSPHSCYVNSFQSRHKNAHEYRAYVSIAHYLRYFGRMQVRTCVPKTDEKVARLVSALGLENGSHPAEVSESDRLDLKYTLWEFDEMWKLLEGETDGVFSDQTLDRIVKLRAFKERLDRSAE